ncbi:MAG: hypothetical protein QNJ22_02545 [Desulfosarcinaceae bacterium]|nr:hypothetical protein [Desulfosarcinaceae bacterium]
MEKYVAFWEVDQTKIPIDRQERGAGWGLLMTMVAQDRETGTLKDWGAFTGENRGYAIYEATKLELMNTLQQYVPFCTFEVHPVSSMGEVNEMISALAGE